MQKIGSWYNRAVTYRELFEKYSTEAKALAAKGDLVQASEKYWGAVAEILKAICERKEWSHHRHRDLVIAIQKLFLETKDADLIRLFASAEELHANFYEDFLRPEGFEIQAGAAVQLIDKLLKIDGVK